MSGDESVDARMWQIFFELHTGLPREAPGDRESAARAWAMAAELPEPPTVLDLGCGPGSATSHLVDLGAGRVVGVDFHLPYVRVMQRKARESGFARRMHAVNGDMKVLPFAAGSFDMVWCEGAIYLMGFAAGLAACFEVLTPGGCLVLTEAVYLCDDPPEAVRAFWEPEYPAITTVAGNLEMIRAQGLELVGHFTLPESAWWHEYYTPLEQRMELLAGKYPGDPVAEAVIEEHRREIDTYRRFSRSYGYEFFVCRKP